MTALASAIASRNAELARAVEAEATTRLRPAEAEAARAAAAIMGMNNVYYRFLHLVEDDEYAKLPAKLRMNVIGSPGIAKAEFELISLAVSAVNGCGKCVTAHERDPASARGRPRGGAVGRPHRVGDPCRRRRPRLRGRPRGDCPLRRIAEKVDCPLLRQPRRQNDE